MARQREMNTLEGIVVAIVVGIILFYEFVLPKIVAWWQQNWVYVVGFIMFIIVGIVLVWFFFIRETEKKRIEREKREQQEEIESEKKRQEQLKLNAEEERANLEEQEKEEKIEMSILRKKIIKERGAELDTLKLNKKEREYQLNKWIEEEYQKQHRKPIQEQSTEIETTPERKPLPPRLKRAIFKAYGSRCAMCGRQEPLRIHHMDGDRTNDNPKNLIPVCGTCHDKKFPIEQYRAKWRPPRFE
jgi:ABC-type multidrug transport system fused ATPase/permease subunit